MNEDLSFIKENCEKIKLRIQAAAQRADRDPEDIRLIAVSKTVDAARIIKALEKIGFRKYAKKPILRM